MLKPIYNDDRGSIYSVEIPCMTDPEYTLFTCKKGYARGGCIHKHHTEYFVVLEGEIIYFIVTMESGMHYKKGESGVILKNTPHYFIAVTDCIVMEWGATIKEKKEKHKEFRKMVDDING